MTTKQLAKSRVAMAALATLVACAALPATAWAQQFPVTSAQRDTAKQVAQRGVPLSELAANAPDEYVVKKGDTLWAIAKMYLKSPWRWPELWGMNLQDIKNPHLIYPGQRLVLERINEVATLRVEGSTTPQTMEIGGLTKVAPRTRYESVAGDGLPTLDSKVIDAFLSEAMVVDENTLKTAARIVATQENRYLLTQGDRAYARGAEGAMLLDDKPDQQKFRIFRNATPLKDPSTGETLGYEARYLGKAELVRGEASTEQTDKDGKTTSLLVPATIDILSVKEEIGVGDRMLPEPPHQITAYVPHAPAQRISGRVVSVYGSAVANAAQNQVVVINRGTRDGIDVGTILAILKHGEELVDKGDANQTMMKLPDERNGLLMVFSVFDRLSYALILDITDAVQIGADLTNPR